MNTRRQFLASAAALGACTAIDPMGRGDEEPERPKRLFEISLAQWSLHRRLFAGELDNLDFAGAAKETYGLDAVEYVNAFFKDRAEDEDYLREMRTRADDHGVRSLLIMVDGEGSLAHADMIARRQAVENHLRWIRAAAFLGCHSIRVNAAGSGTPAVQRDRAAGSLRRLGEYGDEHGIDVIVENHGGLSSDGSWLASVMRVARHPRVGTLPDFGNFRIRDDEWYDRYQGVQELMPFARAVSAKSHDFDEEGNETSTDYRRMLKLVVDAGYRGYVGIEYEGSRLPEDEGIRRTKALLEKVRDELA